MTRRQTIPELLEEAREEILAESDRIRTEARQRELATGDWALAVMAGLARVAVASHRAEDLDDERKGKWSTEWWVFSPEKGEVLYKSEDSAKEGGRYWLKNSSRPDEVRVFCIEGKRYVDEAYDVEREDWEDA